VVVERIRTCSYEHLEMVEVFDWKAHRSIICVRFWIIYKHLIVLLLHSIIVVVCNKDV